MRHGQRQQQNNRGNTGESQQNTRNQDYGYDNRQSHSDYPDRYEASSGGEWPSRDASREGNYSGQNRAENRGRESGYGFNETAGGGWNDRSSSNESDRSGSQRYGQGGFGGGYAQGNSGQGNYGQGGYNEGYAGGYNSARPEERDSGRDGAYGMTGDPAYGRGGRGTSGRGDWGYRPVDSAGQRDRQYTPRSSQSQPVYGSGRSGWEPTGGGGEFGNAYGSQGGEQFGGEAQYGWPPSESGRNNRESSWGNDWSGSSRELKAPKGYTRSEDRIRESVSERFMESSHRLDPSDIEITVESGEVTLKGTVTSRTDKFAAERLAEGILGVKDVTNLLRVKPRSEGSESSTSSGKADAGTNSREGRETPRDSELPGTVTTRRQNPTSGSMTGSGQR